MVRGSFRDSLHTAMFWLVLVNVLIFAWEKTLAAGALEQVFAQWGLSVQGVEGGALWQFVTYAFLHGNFLHLFVNMVSLWCAGRLLEAEIGRGRFLLVYLFSAVGGGLLQMVLGSGNSELIGASGAVFGILLAFTTVFHDQEILALIFFVIPLRLRAPYIGWGLVVFSALALIFQFEPWIGHAAHLGGGITGFLCARALGYGRKGVVVV